MGIPCKVYPIGNKDIGMKNSVIILPLSSSFGYQNWHAEGDLFGLLMFEVKLFGEYWKSLTVPGEQWAIFSTLPSL